MITVGELDTPIIIQKATFTANTNYGGIQSETWGLADAGISSVWAYLIYKGGKESDEGEQKVGEQKVDFYIRFDSYKDTIQPNWRIKFGMAGGSDKYYYIQNIAHIDGRHKITRLSTIQKDNH